MLYLIHQNMQGRESRLQEAITSRMTYRTVYFIICIFKRFNFYDMAISSALHTPTKLIRTICPHTKDLNRELIRNVLVSSWARMKIITRVVQRVELTGDVGIGKELVEIHNGIEHARRADERVDALTRLLALRIGVGLLGEVGWRAERCNGGAEDGDAVCVDEGHHLFVGLSQALVDLLLCFRRCCCGSNIVYSFENHGVFDTRMGEDVAVDATESVGPETIG